MAGKIPEGSMVSRIGLDGEQPVKTLKQLRAAVSGLTSAWKTQQTELKSAGKYADAAKAKYDGLGKSIDQQKSYIAQLKSSQSQLDQSTNEGAEQFAKLAKQISTATTKLASMEGQQNRAKQSVDYYKSGLAELRFSYDQITSVGHSYVERLREEGHQRDANRVQIGTYRDSIENLTKQLKLQEDELSKIAKSGDTTSDAYKKQEVRVNETATSLAKAKNQMNDFNDAMHKANPSVFDVLNKKLGLTKTNAEDAHKSLSDIIKGSAIGSAIGNGISNLASDLADAAKQGFQLDVAGDELKKRWSDLGLPTKAVAGLMNQIGQIRGASNESGAAINQLQVKLYNLTGGSIPRTEALTNELFAFGKQAGLSGDQIDGMGAKLTRLFSTQKVNLSTFNRTFAGLPALKQAIVQASGMTSDAFTKALSAGKITGQQLQDLMVKAANQSGKAWSDFSETSAGKLARVQGTFTNLKAAFMKPIETSALNGINSVLDSVVNKKGDLTSTGKTINGMVSDLSKHVGDSITAFFKYLSEHKKDVSGVVSDVVTITKDIAKDVWKDFSEIILDIGKYFGIINDNSRKSEDPMKQFREIMDDLAKNKGAIKFIADSIVTIASVKGLAATVRTLSTLAQLKPKKGGLISALLNPPALTKKVAQSAETSEEESEAGKLAGAGAAGAAGATVVSRAAGGASLLSRALPYVAPIAKLGAITSAVSVGSKYLGAGITGKSSSWDKANAAGGAGLAGAGIGAGIGLLGGPAGAIAGAQIGGSIGTALGSTKTAQTWAKNIRKSLSNAIKNSTQGITIKPKVESPDSKHLGNSFEKAIKTLNKKLLIKPVSDPKSWKQASSTVTSTYSKLSKSVDSYYRSKEAKAKKDLQELVANGTITQKDADKRYAKLVASDNKSAAAKKKMYAKMESDAKSYLSKVATIQNGGTSKLEKLAQKYGTNSEKYQKEKQKELLAAYNKYIKTYIKDALSGNAKVTAAESKASTDQKRILTKFNKDKNKLNLAQLSNTQKYANKIYNADVKPAKKARDAIISAANSKYKKVIAAANREYKDDHAITKKQYQDIVGKAKDQRDKTTGYAEDQYKKVTKHARNQHKEVADAIDKQRKSVVKSMSTQRSNSARESRAQARSVVEHSEKEANNSMKASSKQANGVSSIWNKLGSWWNDFIGMFGGKKVSPHSVRASYTPVTGLENAAASGGSISADMTALVGEQGPELRYKPWSGSYDILGKNGAELADVHQGDYILNATDTAKLLSGNFDSRLPGYASGTSSIGSFINGLAKSTSKIWDKISSKAEKFIKSVGNPISFLTKKAESIFNPKSVSDSGSIFTNFSSGLIKGIIKGLSDAFKKIKKKVQDIVESVANPSGSGVMRWKPDVIKALKANGFDATDLQVKSWLDVIQRESGGNPHAINLWDSNAKAGIPSMGLVQTIGPTFDAYKFPGHGNVYNGFDDLLAGIHYMKAIYGSGNGAFERVADPNIGYANGGIATVPSIFGEDGPEVAIPLGINHRTRATELLDQTSQILKGDAFSQNSNEQLKQIVKMLATMLVMLSESTVEDKLTKIVNSLNSTTSSSDNSLGSQAIVRQLAKILSPEFARLNKLEQMRSGKA